MNSKKCAYFKKIIIIFKQTPIMMCDQTLNDIDTLIQKITDELNIIFNKSNVSCHFNETDKLREINHDIKNLSDIIDTASIDNIKLDNIKFGTRINQAKKTLETIKHQFTCVADDEKKSVVITVTNSVPPDVAPNVPDVIPDVTHGIIHSIVPIDAIIDTKPDTDNVKYDDDESEQINAIQSNNLELINNSENSITYIFSDEDAHESKSNNVNNNENIQHNDDQYINTNNIEREFSNRRLFILFFCVFLLVIAAIITKTKS